MPPKLPLPHNRGHFFLFQNCPRGEGNCAAIERQKLSRGNFCLAASRCLSGPSGWGIFPNKVPGEFCGGFFGGFFRAFFVGKNRRKKSTKKSTAKFKSEFGSFTAKIHTARIRLWVKIGSGGGVRRGFWVQNLDGPNRQSPIASVQRTRSTLAGHSAGPCGANTTPTNANRAIRIAVQRTQGLRGPNSVFLGGDMTANER